MTTDVRRIVVVGFMGAGKTTVAAALARPLGGASIDLDELIVEREGRTISAIIDEDGEPRFREIETRALRAALDESDARVFAFGGGAWIIEANRTLVAQSGCRSVWLDAPFELCWQRIGKSGATRPFARDEAKARVLFEARRPFYQLADLRVHCRAEQTAAEVAAEITRALESLPQQNGSAGADSDSEQ